MNPENDNQQPNENPEEGSTFDAPERSTEPNTQDTPQETPSQDDPADALSRTPDELAEEKAEREAAKKAELEKTKAKQPSKIKRFLKKINLYFLMFLLLFAVVAAIAVINFLNSQKDPVAPTLASQELTEEALKKLANTDASVGRADQTLTIQGNAIIDGQTLMRGNLNIAGNLQTGGSIQGPEITISGAANLGNTQVNSLQVAADTAIQGSTTMRDLSVSGSATFSGAISASQLTVTNLIMSGNATLEVPNHISFTGPSPNRSINAGVLGSGGSASVNGSDTTGTVNINTGNGPTAGCFTRINFNQRFAKQPRVMISPVGSAAGLTNYYVDRDQAGFSICASTPAPANQSFAFDYFITN